MYKEWIHLTKHNYLYLFCCQNNMQQLILAQLVAGGVCCIEMYIYLLQKYIVYY